MTRTAIARWDELQIVTAQLAELPLLDDEEVGSELVVGPNTARPLLLDIPLFVSDMEFRCPRFPPSHGRGDTSTDSDAATSP